MAGIPDGFKDIPHATLDERVANLLRHLVKDRTNQVKEIEEVECYHLSKTTTGQRHKHIVATSDTVYSVKTGLEFNSSNEGEFNRCVINLEIPRDRPDIKVESVMNKKGKEFILTYLGDMQLPSILVEKNDSMTKEELCQTIQDLVQTGQARQLIFNESLPDLEVGEIQPTTLFIMIRRFEEQLRRFIKNRMEDAYGDQWFQRLETLLGKDLPKIRERAIQVGKKYGQVPDDVVQGEEIFEHMGFEHYRNIFANNKVWKKCFESYFTSKEEVGAGLIRIADARNEIYHNRSAVNPYLWVSCRVEMDSIIGQIQMDREKMNKLVAMVNGNNGPIRQTSS